MIDKKYLKNFLDATRELMQYMPSEEQKEAFRNYTMGLIGCLSTLIPQKVIQEIIDEDKENLNND